jgi:predicted porin
LKAAAYYHHEENQGGAAAVTTSTGTQDALQFTLGLKYTINKHFELHVDYEYSAQSSGGTGGTGGTSGYSRNRYFGGLTYKY